jgi:hypothetical protein
LIALVAHSHVFVDIVCRPQPLPGRPPNLF